MKVILDNGHGRDTAGKRSPDGRLREYAYTREMARRIAQDLKRQGIDVSLLVPEDTDVPLKERVERANRIYAETGKQAILVSIHVNAAGNGSTWFSARGWSVFVDPAASQDSERLATSIAEAAGNIGLTVRRETGGRNYWVSSLYICKHTNCPAVLTENLFQDNREDVDYLFERCGQAGDSPFARKRNYRLFELVMKTLPWLLVGMLLVVAFGAGYAPSIPLPREIGRKTPRRLSIRFPTSSRFPGIA